MSTKAGVTAYYFLDLGTSAGRIKMRRVKADRLSSIVNNSAVAAAGSELEDCIATSMTSGWAVPDAGRWAAYDVLYNGTQEVAAR